MPTPRAIADSLRTLWRTSSRSERAACYAGALLLIAGLAHVAVLIATRGSWEGPLSLRKPATFGLSFGITLVTIAWVSSFLTMGERTRAMLLGIFAAACVLETVLVTLQAWRGVPSHFNLETSFDATVARLLAGGGAVLIIVIVALTAIAFRRNAAVPLSLRLAIRVGFVALCSSLAIGAVMIARGMVLVFRGEARTAYTNGGWLKPSHAVTMHAILLLPLAAWLLSLTDWSERQRLAIVVAVSVGYIVFAAAVIAANAVGR